MPRIRTIRPSLWRDERVISVQIPHRLLYIGLHNFADDEGRLSYDLTNLRRTIFPFDKEFDIEEAMESLARVALVSIYTVDEERYIQITDFAAEQVVNRKKASRFPPVPEEVMSNGD